MFSEEHRVRSYIDSEILDRLDSLKMLDELGNSRTIWLNLPSKMS